MMIELNDPAVAATLASAVLHFVLAVVVRPRIPADSWAKLGPLAAALDVVFGNYAHAANSKSVTL